MPFRVRVMLVTGCLLATGAVGAGAADAASPIDCMGSARGFAGAEQPVEADGAQADLRIDAPPLREAASQSGASVILTDRARAAFAQVGWVTQRPGAASSFAAWSLRDGGVAMRTVPQPAIGSLVVFKILRSDGELAFWFDHVDGAPVMTGITSDLDVAEAQVEAEHVGGGRLAGTRSDPSVLGWIAVRVAGRWSRFAPRSVGADAGLGVRRVSVLDGEDGSHLLVWDRNCAGAGADDSTRTAGLNPSSNQLRDVFGVELRGTSGRPAISADRARSVALAATGARRALSTRFARCSDDQLVPALRTGCYVVAVDPGIRAQPPIGPRGGRTPEPLRSLVALIDARSGKLLETLAH